MIHKFLHDVDVCMEVEGGGGEHGLVGEGEFCGTHEIIVFKAFSPKYTTTFF